jgi:hypothetical protein
MSINVASVNFDVVDAPFCESLRIYFEVAKDSGVPPTGVIAVVLVDPELQAQAVNLNLKKCKKMFNTGVKLH